MDQQKILRAVDHTLLKPQASWKEIQQIIEDGMKYQTASVCIPASYVARAADYAKGRVAICTVIGFPCGYSTTAAKCFEAADAAAKGAAEIDMVVNLGLVKAGDFSAVEQEIAAVRAAVPGRILKVIIETCLLTDEEKIALCRAVTAAGADFIKTSTGFSTGGATVSDVRLLREHVGPEVKVKASGGISSLADAEAMLAAGASRLGTSRVVKIALEQGLVPPME